jgi:hypothetical protein
MPVSIEKIPRRTKFDSSKQQLKIYDMINERMDELYDQGARIKDPRKHVDYSEDDKELKALYYRHQRLINLRTKEEWEELREKLRKQKEKHAKWNREANEARGGKSHWTFDADEILDRVREKRAEEDEVPKTEEDEVPKTEEDEVPGGVSVVSVVSETPLTPHTETEENEVPTYYVAKVWSDGRVEPI